MRMLGGLAEGRFAKEILSALPEYGKRDSSFGESLLITFIRYNSPSPEFENLPLSAKLAAASMSIGIGQEPVGLRRPVLISGSSGLVSIVLNGSTPLTYCDAMNNYDDPNKSVKRQLTGYNLDGSVMAHASLNENGIYILGREGGEENRGKMTLWTPSGKVAIGRFNGADIPSTLHAALFSFDRGVAVADLGSSGGTFVVGNDYSNPFSVHFPGRSGADKPVHSAKTVTGHVPASCLHEYLISIDKPVPKSDSSVACRAGVKADHEPQ